MWWDVDNTRMNDDASKYLYGICEWSTILGCTLIKLSQILCFFSIKWLRKVIYKAFSILLDLLRVLISNWKEKLPKSFYEKDNCQFGFGTRELVHVQIIVRFIGLRIVIWSNAIHARDRDDVHQNFNVNRVKGKRLLPKTYVIFVDAKASMIVYDKGNGSQHALAWKFMC